MTRKREPDYWLPKYKKREIKAQVKARGLEFTPTEARALRRELRKRLRNDTFKDIGLDLPKPGKFISDMYRSSGHFKSAYSFARSEAEFYDQARYADY